MLLPVKKILAPTDYSELSYKGVVAADELARHFGAELLLINVVTSMQVLQPIDSTIQTSYQISNMFEDFMDIARANMDFVINKKVSDGVVNRSFVLSGSPAEEIVKLASEENVDAIVIATHGFTGWRRIVFGLVAERVVRFAECPVITIPAGKDEK
ncbi:MAG: universal stress protein [Proteobacteria bacterium]|nr:universal stress protein [Pseudomonadota bacterium]